MDIEDIKKVSIKKGDILVIKSALPMTAEQMRRLSEAVKRCAPDGAKLMVLDSGMEMEVLEWPDA